MKIYIKNKYFYEYKYTLVYPFVFLIILFWAGFDLFQNLKEVFYPLLYKKNIGIPNFLMMAIEIIFFLISPIIVFLYFDKDKGKEFPLARGIFICENEKIIEFKRPFFSLNSYNFFYIYAFDTYNDIYYLNDLVKKEKHLFSVRFFDNKGKEIKYSENPNSEKSYTRIHENYSSIINVLTNSYCLGGKEIRKIKTMKISSKAPLYVNLTKG